MQPINIFDMVDKKEQARKELLNKACLYMKLATNEGKSKEVIAEQLKRLDLPLDIHLCIMGHFTEICKHGRLLTKTERSFLKL